MIISGTLHKTQASVEEVAKTYFDCLRKCVPEDVPGIVFLSGGQSNELATKHLNEMNKQGQNASVGSSVFHTVELCSNHHLINGLVKMKILKLLKSSIPKK